MNFQKLILPGLVLITIGVIYLVFFSPQRGLGSFSSIDPDSHAQRELKVRFVAADGIDRMSNPGKVTFYAADKVGKKMKISATEVPNDLESAENVVIIGHLHGNVFEAVEVRIE